MKKFNITGVCIPQKHYMVDTSEKIDRIAEMVRQGDYFTINRARQYGKTTTLVLLERKLKKDGYLVFSLSFEGFGDTIFSSEQRFINSFILLCSQVMRSNNVGDDIIQAWESKREDLDFLHLGFKINELSKGCKKEIVLMIDEVDKTSNNQVFLDFLGMLRNRYLDRWKNEQATFHSVILAGVYDIKNIKLKLRPDEHRSYNSPWNIAASFDVDMSFSSTGIASMLIDYERDHQTGMNITEMSEALYIYTNGYPYLVSALCKIIDERLGADWSVAGVRHAADEILREKTPLFESIIKNLEEYPGLHDITETILLSGETVLYNIDNRYIDLGVTFGLFKRDTRNVEFYNTIFETRIYNYMISTSKLRMGIPEDSRYIENGRLNMEHVLTRFQSLMKSEYRWGDSEFIEKQGRLLFLCFLKPIINGTGHYAVEPETRENTRMDVVVYYGSEEHIVELKIWHGDRTNDHARAQLSGYLESRGQSKGYLVSFCFTQNKTYTAEWVNVGDKDIFEVVV